MGSALLRGWLAGRDDRFVVLDPQAPCAELRSEHVSFFTDRESFSRQIDGVHALVLAVKPQIMDEACSALKAHVAPDTLVLSIAAGQSVAALKARFSTTQPIVRAMPNTPAAIGQGITAAFASPEVDPARRAWADELLRAVGQVHWIADESLMDAVTAVSGSGPAYVFLLMEILAAAGARLGLEENLAAALARQTVIGSGALAAAQPQSAAAALRQAVTSPGGTTAAALAVLMDGKLQALFDAALTAARDRGKSLGQKT